jgi:hypothetical protein
MWRPTKHSNCILQFVDAVEAQSRSSRIHISKLVDQRGDTHAVAVPRPRLSGEGLLSLVRTDVADVFPSIWASGTAGRREGARAMSAASLSGDGSQGRLRKARQPIPGLPRSQTLWKN